jgi:hypothetical protein
MLLHQADGTWQAYSGEHKNKIFVVNPQEKLMFERDNTDC